MTPRARVDELVVREVEDETLVYDLKRHRAHSLNQTAALVWRWCDGRTTVLEMAQRLQAELRLPADEEVVLLALDRLGRSHLLQERVTSKEEAVRVSRRAVARKVAMAAGMTVLLPVVTSIVAPTPAAAATCLATGQSCTQNTQCCSGSCLGIVFTCA